MESRTSTSRSRPARGGEEKSTASASAPEVRRSGRVRSNMGPGPSGVLGIASQGSRGGKPGTAPSGKARRIEEWGSSGYRESAATFGSRIAAKLQEYQLLGRRLREAKEEIKYLRVRAAHGSKKSRSELVRKIKAQQKEIKKIEGERMCILEGAGPFREKLENEARFAKMKEGPIDASDSSGESDVDMEEEDSQRMVSQGPEVQKSEGCDETSALVSAPQESQQSTQGSDYIPAAQAMQTALPETSEEEEDDGLIDGGLLKTIIMQESPVHFENFLFGDDEGDTSEGSGGKRKKKKKKKKEKLTKLVFSPFQEPGPAGLVDQTPAPPSPSAGTPAKEQGNEGGKMAAVIHQAQPHAKESRSWAKRTAEKGRELPSSGQSSDPDAAGRGGIRAKEEPGRPATPMAAGGVAQGSLHDRAEALGKLGAGGAGRLIGSSNIRKAGPGRPGSAGGGATLTSSSDELGDSPSVKGAASNRRGGVGRSSGSGGGPLSYLKSSPGRPGYAAAVGVPPPVKEAAHGRSGEAGRSSVAGGGPPVTQGAGLGLPGGADVTGRSSVGGATARDVSAAMERTAPLSAVKQGSPVSGSNKHRVAAVGIGEGAEPGGPGSHAPFGDIIGQSPVGGGSAYTVKPQQAGEGAGLNGAGQSQPRTGSEVTGDLLVGGKGAVLSPGAGKTSVPGIIKPAKLLYVKQSGQTGRDAGKEVREHAVGVGGTAAGITGGAAGTCGAGGIAGTGGSGGAAGSSGASGAAGTGGAAWAAGTGGAAGAAGTTGAVGAAGTSGSVLKGVVNGAVGGRRRSVRVNVDAGEGMNGSVNGDQGAGTPAAEVGGASGTKRGGVYVAVQAAVNDLSSSLPSGVPSAARSYADAARAGSSLPSSGTGGLQQRLLEALRRGDRTIQVEGRDVDLSFWIERHGLGAFREKRGEVVWSLPTPGQEVGRRNVARLVWRGSEACPQRGKVVELLFQMGFKVEDIFALIHPLGSPEFDISFVRPEGLELFWSNYELVKNEPGWRGFLAKAVSRQSSVKKVTVLTRNESLSCYDIMTWLSRYGEVTDIPRKNLDQHGIWSGAWTFSVRLKRAGNTVAHMPSAAFLGRDRIQVFYQGQPKLCHRCGDPTHFSANCTKQVCALCGDEGHLAASCGRIRCHLCGDLGHPFSRCPRAFLNVAAARAGENSDGAASAGEGTSGRDGVAESVKRKHKSPSQMRREERRMRSTDLESAQATGSVQDPAPGSCTEALSDTELNEEIRRLRKEEAGNANDSDSSQYVSLVEEEEEEWQQKTKSNRGRGHGRKRPGKVKKKPPPKKVSDQVPQETLTDPPLVDLSNRYQSLGEAHSLPDGGEHEGLVSGARESPGGAEPVDPGVVSQGGQAVPEDGSEEQSMDTSLCLKRVKKTGPTVHSSAPSDSEEGAKGKTGKKKK